MSTRSVEARVTKLEAARSRPDEILVVWRRPGTAVADAVASVSYAPGDKVICVEWFNDDEPLPPSKWCDGQALPKHLGEHIERTCRALIDQPRPRPPGLKPILFGGGKRANSMTDNELLYCIFGVAT